MQHKERIKQLRTNVDVLTLTATPIPRTLELSLTGIRDLSLVNTPPEDRQPILTYVGEYDDRAVAEAIRRELLREGQVFYVHNRVRDIELVAENVRALVPEARVAVAHGQMDEARLERVVLDFWEHEFDVLVCTTIVESGIDMPTVNTLVVDRSDLLGLAQLYQLRGRVGRRGQRAYAYLFHPPDRVLTEEAYERLKTIGEFTDLGSGFKIAMRDLEIRGAGNLLGAGAVGPHRRGRVRPLLPDGHRGGRRAEGRAGGTSRSRSPIDVPVDANLPRDYVARDDVRMEAYRRLAAVTDRRRRRRHPRRVGGPLRAAAARRRPRCSTWRRLRVECGAARHRGRSPCSAASRASPGSCCASRRRCGCGGSRRRPSPRTTASWWSRSAHPRPRSRPTLVELLDELVPPAGRARRSGRASLRSAMSEDPRSAPISRRRSPSVMLALGSLASSSRRRRRGRRWRRREPGGGHGQRRQDVGRRRSTTSSTASPSSDVLRAAVRDASPPRTFSASNGSISATGTAQWLNYRIADHAGRVDPRPATARAVTDADVNAASGACAEQGVTNGMSSSTAAQLVRFSASGEALVDELGYDEYRSAMRRAARRSTIDRRPEVRPVERPAARVCVPAGCRPVASPSVLRHNRPSGQSGG